MVFFLAFENSEKSEQTSYFWPIFYFTSIRVQDLLVAVRTIGKAFGEHWILWFAPSNTWKVIIVLIVNQDVILVSVLSRMPQIFCEKNWILLGQSHWERKIVME